MLILTSRILRDVTFDPAEQRFLGRVEIAFHDSIDGAPFTARLRVTVNGPHRSRYAQIEAALLDEAERDLRLRLANLPKALANVFAPVTHTIPASTRKAA